MLERKKLLKDTAFYTGTTYLVQFISFIRGVIVAKLLKPALYGYFSGLGLILLYNAYSHLGVLQGMFREASIEKGTGQTGEIEELRNNAFSFILLTAMVVFFILYFYSIIEAGKLGPYITWGFRAFALICVLNHQEMLYHDLLRLDHRFSEINFSKLIFSVSNLVFSVILILIWGFYGVLIAFIFSMILENLYLMSRGKYRFKISIQKKIIWHFLRTGFPIALTFLSLILLNSIDRLMIIHYLSATELGFYGIALAFSILLFKFAETISYVIQPKIFEHFGSHDRDEKSLIEIYEKSTLVLSVAMAILAGIFFIIIAPTINYILPSYAKSIIVCQILIFGIFFFSVNQIALRIIMAIGNFMALVGIQIVTIFINVLLNFLAIKHNYGINGIAIATSISYFIYSFVTIQFLFRGFKTPLIKAFIKNIKTYLPVFMAGFVLYLLSNIPNFKEDLLSNIISCLIQISILLIFFIPFLIVLERQTNIFSLAKNIIARK